jgi:hypothetical protein
LYVFVFVLGKKAKTDIFFESTLLCNVLRWFLKCQTNAY